MYNVVLLMLLLPVRVYNVPASCHLSLVLAVPYSTEVQMGLWVPTPQLEGHSQCF